MIHLAIMRHTSHFVDFKDAQFRGAVYNLNEMCVVFAGGVAALLTQK